MDRLQAILKHVDDDGFDRSYVETTLIANWMNYLGRIEPRADATARIPEVLCRNLGHRLQLMEFEAALLLLDRETKRNYAGRSTLFETVSKFKIHQFTVLCHTVIEGIASHLYRTQKATAGEITNPAIAVLTGQWRGALIDDLLPRLDPQTGRDELDERIKRLTLWRNKIHLDKIAPYMPVHFDEFTYDDCFVPAYKTFQFILTSLNQNWPDTCLNEQLAFA